MLQDVNATYPKVRALAASGNVAAFNSALCDAVAVELTISMLAKGEAALVEDVKYGHTAGVAGLPHQGDEGRARHGLIYACREALERAYAIFGCETEAERKRVYVQELL